MFKRNNDIDHYEGRNSLEINAINMDVSEVIKFYGEEINKVYQSIGDDFLISTDKNIYVVGKKFRDEVSMKNLIKIKFCDIDDVSIKDDHLFILAGNKVYLYNKEYRNYGILSITLFGFNHRTLIDGTDIYTVTTVKGERSLYLNSIKKLRLEENTYLKYLDDNFIILSNSNVTLDDGEEYYFIDKNTYELKKRLNSNNLIKMDDGNYLIIQDRIQYVYNPINDTRFTFMDNLNEGTVSTGGNFMLGVFTNFASDKYTLYNKKNMTKYMINFMSSSIRRDKECIISKNGNFIISYLIADFDIGKIDLSNIITMQWENSSSEDDEEDDEIRQLTERFRRL